MSPKGLKIGAKLLIIIFAILFIVTLVFDLVGRFTQKQTLDAEVLKNVKETVQKFENLEERDTHILGSALEVFLQDQDFKNIYLQKDREKLYQYGQPLFQKLKDNHDVTHFYFHLPDGTNFVRLHNKDIYGDLITRKTFYKARDTKEPGTGIELGKTAFALRVVVPYYDDNELIGYVEFGEEINHFLKILKAETGDEFAVIGDKEYLDREKWASVKQAAGLRDNWDDMEEHVLLGGTLEEQIATEECFVEENVEFAEEGVVVIKRIQAENKNFTCAGFPILDPEGKDIGVVLMLDNVSDFVDITNKANLTLLGASAILFILALLLFNLLISRIVTEPISEARNVAVEIARGNMDIAIIPRSNDEIGELAATFNKMVKDLKSSRAALEEAKTTLEIKVQARTVALEHERASLEEKVKQRTKELEKRLNELERFHKLAVGRELRMVELKKNIKELEIELKDGT